jgi:hypothetical protein
VPRRQYGSTSYQVNSTTGLNSSCYSFSREKSYGQIAHGVVTVSRVGGAGAQVRVNVNVVTTGVDVDENIIGANGMVREWKKLAVNVAGRIGCQKLQVSRGQLNLHMNQPATQKFTAPSLVAKMYKNQLVFHERTY